MVSSDVGNALKAVFKAGISSNFFRSLGEQ
jgi:hypothetical protein